MRKKNESFKKSSFSMPIFIVSREQEKNSTRSLCRYMFLAYAVKKLINFKHVKRICFDKNLQREKNSKFEYIYVYGCA